MPKTVTIAGHQVRRGPVIVAVAGIVGVGGWYLYKHATAAQTSTTPGSSQYGYGTGAYGYGSNYAYGYGSGGYGYGQYVPPGGDYYGYGQYGYGYYGPGGYGGSGFPSYPPGYTPTTTTPNSTNQQWAQSAAAALTAQGFTGRNVAIALGKYLTGKPLNTDQQNIVTTAIGLEGDPPQDGAGGFPPAMHTTSTHHTPKPTDVTVPNVVGIDYENAAKILQEIGLTPRRGRPNVGIVASESPKAGSKVKKGAKVTLQGRPQGRKPH